MYDKAIAMRMTARYVTGVIISVALAYTVNWPLAYVMPVFVAKFFADRKPPTRQTWFELLEAMLGTVFIAIIVSRGLSSYPLVLLAFIALIMFWAYYLFQDPQQDFFAMMLMMGILLVPYMSLSAPGLGMMLGTGLLVSGALAICVFWLLYVLIPCPDPQKGTPQKATAPDHHHRVCKAFEALLVSFPVIALTYVLQLDGAVLAMAYIGLLSLELSAEKSARLSRFLLLANIGGGVIAVLLWELLVMVPRLPFFLALMTLVCWLFAKRVFGPEPGKAMMSASAFSAILVLLGAVLTIANRDMEVSFYARIGQIALASGYLVFAAWMLEFRKSVVNNTRIHTSDCIE